MMADPRARRGDGDDGDEIAAAKNTHGDP